MLKCPVCNAPMEQADYLEGSEDFESAFVCMSEECHNSSYNNEQEEGV